MGLRTAALLLAAISPAGVTIAAPYQGEILATYYGLETDSTYSLQGHSLRATAYFAPVSSEGRPLQEAAFLDRASNIAFTHLHFDADRYTMDFLRADVSYYVPNTFFFVGGHYLRIEESASAYAAGYSENDWGATLGLAPADGLLIYTKYRSAPSISGFAARDTVNTIVALEAGGYDPNITLKYVATTEGGRTWKVESTVIHGEDLDFAYAGGDYFLNQSFSLGFWVERFSFSHAKYGVRTEKFLTHQISLQGSAIELDHDYAWEVGARLRF